MASEPLDSITELEERAGLRRLFDLRVGLPIPPEMTRKVAGYIARLEAEVKFLKSAPCPFEAENTTLKDEIEAVALALLGPGATYQPAQLALEVAALKAQVERLSAVVSDEEWMRATGCTMVFENELVTREDLDEMIAARKEAGNG